MSLQGTALFDAAGNGYWQPVRQDDTLCEGGRLRIEPHSRASLSLPNGIILRINAGAIVSLNGIKKEEPTALDLVKGFIHIISRPRKRLQITSPIINAGPEGTEFAMDVAPEKASVWVYEGAVRVFNGDGALRLSSGQGAESMRGQGPRALITINPEDAVSWALYYPPILPSMPTAVTDERLGQALNAYRRGHIDSALAPL